MNLIRTLGAAATVIVGVWFTSAAQASLVGLWQFEGDASDSSLFGNHGTLMNGASLSANTPPALTSSGQSLNVNGGTQHALVPHDAGLDMTNAMTIAAWVHPVGSGWDGIVAKNPSSNGSSNNEAGNYELRITSGSRMLNFLHQPIGVVNGTVDTFSTAANTIPGNVWTHVAVAVDAQTTTYYINGTAVHTANTPGNFGATNTNPLFIGSRADLATAMDGLLDDVAVFRQKLTQSDIQTIMGGDFRSFSVGDPAPAGSRIGNVTVADFSSQLTGGPFNRQAQFLVDGSGLTPTEGHSVAPERTMWLTAGVGFGAVDDHAPFVTFDLGAPTYLGEIQVWNYNENNLQGRGVAQMEVSIGDSPGGPYTSLGIYNLAVSPGGNMTDFSQLLEVQGFGRFVRFDILSNHNGVNFPTAGGGPDASFVGLSEVRFFTVPEPGTYALGLLGAAGIAVLLWRRRKCL